MRICKICGKGELEEVKDIKLKIKESIFVAKGHRCNACGEGFPYEYDTQRIMDHGFGICKGAAPFKEEKEAHDEFW